MKKRVLAMIMVVALAIGLISGCGNSKGNAKGGNSKTDIEICLLYAGFGDEFLDKIVKSFNEKYPEYNAYFTTTASEEAIRAKYGLEDVDTVDIYMATEEYDTTYLEPLNDVLDTTVEGEAKSIKEKFDEPYLAAEEYEGKYYNLTWGGGVIGFVYNEKIFEEAGVVQLPRTTDELAMVCATLADAGVKPLCHFQGGGYYSSLDTAWFAQYEGIDKFYDFYENPSKEKMLEKDGRYEVLKVHEKLNTPDNVLQGSNTESHVSMQTKFLEGKCAMMLNGTWLANEMSNIGTMDGFSMMKTPVISSIVNKLKTVKSDPELRALITAIDNVVEGTEKIEKYQDGENYNVNGTKVSATDWDYVKAARYTMPSTFEGANSLYIPTYSNAKEGAKEFLKYFYSDEGYQIYADTLHAVMPMSFSDGEVDTSSWSAFEQEQVQLIRGMEYGVSESFQSKDKIFWSGNASAFARYSYVNLMCSKSEEDRINANQAWEKITATINDKYDNEWLLNVK